jgi:phosphohistidine swiveling domain-containing protein
VTPEMVTALPLVSGLTGEEDIRMEVESWKSSIIIFSNKSLFSRSAVITIEIKLPKIEVWR